MSGSKPQRSEVLPRESPSAKPGRLEQLDALRGLAAVSVVLWHWILVWTPQTTPGTATVILLKFLKTGNFRLLEQISPGNLIIFSPLRIFVGGTEAVVLFFVLSGFVLSLPFWANRQTSYGPYITRRIFRIYVPYLGALVLAVTGDWLFSRGGIPQLNPWFNHTWDHRPAPGSVWGNALLIGSIDENYFNTAFWSLVHEMRISIIFPIVMALARKWGDRIYWVPLPVIIVGITLNSVTPAGRWFESIEVLGFFLAGACLARVMSTAHEWYRGMARSGRYAFIFLSLCLYTFGWAWNFPARLLHWDAGYRDVFVCAGATGIVASALVSQRIKSFLLLPVPRALGTISYSLYLVHATVLWSAIYLLFGHAAPVKILAIYLIVAMAISLVFWRLVEDPAHHCGQKLAKRMASRSKAVQPAVPVRSPAPMELPDTGP